MRDVVESMAARYSYRPSLDLVRRDLLRTSAGATDKMMMMIGCLAKPEHDLAILVLDHVNLTGVGERLKIPINSR